ncbi:MAG: hypothetical protein WCW61_02525 [Patescibacteria group bacterium]|jgi:hypothetical protein
MNYPEQIEFVGTIVLPKFVGVISYADAFHQAGITPSRLFNNMFLEGLITNLPERKVDCYRAKAEITSNCLSYWCVYLDQGLDPADIWRLFNLNETDSETKFRIKGACNTVLISAGSDRIWHAQILKTRNAGWKAELYRQDTILFGELIFSGHVSETEK